MVNAKEHPLKLKLLDLRDIWDLNIQLFEGALFGNIEDNPETKSVMGSFICLSNSSLKINPLN